jgi:hypothetical protein
MPTAPTYHLSLAGIPVPSSRGVPHDQQM